jgi:hypothetical protein
MSVVNRPFEIDRRQFRRKIGGCLLGSEQRAVIIAGFPATQRDLAHHLRHWYILACRMRLCENPSRGAPRLMFLNASWSRHDSNSF